MFWELSNKKKNMYRIEQASVTTAMTFIKSDSKKKEGMG